ncbi:MAG: class I SAM-dependent methyltransferase [Clostridiales bacterium]|jgi:ubiquinone/menaquinone biosynthesis C-methylase UbiE|nr:class I SAM-dependent methyltransferase [Clostridiales bacterium]
MTFWDATARIYDFFEKFNPAYTQMIQRLTEIIPKNSTILELAAGTGNISKKVSHKAKSVLCTDISNSMLKVAKGKMKNISNVEFALDSIYDINQSDNSFDVVIASQVFHLLDEPKKAAIEIKRVAKDIAIMPIPITKDANPWGKFLIGLYRLFGYRGKKMSFEECKEFVSNIGFKNCEFILIKGIVPIAIAIWSK